MVKKYAIRRKTDGLLFGKQLFTFYEGDVPGGGFFDTVQGARQALRHYSIDDIKNYFEIVEMHTTSRLTGVTENPLFKKDR